MDVISTEALSVSHVKEALEKRKKEQENLEYEQAEALEHAEKYGFNGLDAKSSDKLVRELLKNEKINQETAVKIVDINPKTPELLKAIFVKDKIDVTDEEIVAILNIFSGSKI